MNRVPETATPLAPCPLFVELCAGTAAVSLRLHDAKGRPLLGRIGSKRGYADAILAAIGLAPGQGALRYVWCEPDEHARRLLGLHVDGRALSQAVEDVRTFGEQKPRSVFARLLLDDDRSPARSFLLCRWAYRLGFPDSGFNDAATKVRPKTATDHGSRGRTALTEAAFLARSVTSMPAEVYGRAVPPEIVAGPLPPGTVCYIDPPYVGTTGYGHDLPRSEVVRLAREWSEAGAAVAVSEAEPIADLVADGWHAIEITDYRTGQKRTFSKQQREWLTMNREPRLPTPASVG